MATTVVATGSGRPIVTGPEPAVIDEELCRCAVLTPLLSLL
jgi:hypothetical protein